MALGEAQAVDVAEDLRGVLVRADVLIDLANRAVLVDQESPAPNPGDFRSVRAGPLSPDPVLIDDLPVSVGDQGEVKVVLLIEGLLRPQVVRGHADDRDAAP